jgi:class 3 adenylate cyclase/predicted ATPase
VHTTARATVPGPDPEKLAERRVCSLLFCDVVGFTPLSEARDPEAVRELLSAYFAVARTVVGRYGGVVEKFIGDAVMAVWGTPVATEEDAERAVRAALDLVTAVAELGRDAGVPGLAARAGVVTGEVAVTLGAVHEGMVAGDAVNTAARVQSAAEPGQVLVDALTNRVAGSAIGFAHAGEHQLKGKAGPQPLWRATRVLSAVGGVQRVDGLEAPLVGRDAELRTVKDLFHAAADRRVARLVLVSGPAGVGKSRLGWEFEKYADGLAAEVWWHRGRCLSYGEGVAFWALAEMVRQRLGIAEEDPAEAAAAKLAEGLSQSVPDVDERAYVSVRVGRLLGVPAAGDDAVALSREELFAGWRLFFERLAAVQPVVLLVEDAQYVDGGLLDFLDHLIDWAKNLPVYVLMFARPELDQIRPGFGTGRNRVTLTLDPLDPASMDQLVDALVPGMPAAARSKITDHAQGVPLFAVETVRSLIDRDIVQPVEGVYRLTGDIGELVVPDSLHALLAARLDALAPGVRQLIADASVLGTTFPAEALVAVSGQDETAVRGALADLVRREVLSMSADPLSPERGNYQFAQEMLRQVAYDTLSRRDRKTRHLAVAAHVRTAFAGDGEEMTDVIARHYLDALRAIPDDPDIAQIRGQAVSALIRAAERAERTGAPARAATSYATAAQVSPMDHADGADAAAVLWERAAQAAITDGSYAAAIDYAGRARAQRLSRADSRAAARAQAIAGHALRQWGRHAEAREQLISAVDVLRAEPDTDTVSALGELAALEIFAGSSDADRLSTEALTLGEALDVGARQLAELFATHGIYLAIAEQRAQSIAYLRESARLATQAGDSFTLGRALSNLSDVLAATDPAAAADTARTAIGHLRRVGNSDGLAFATGNLAEALLDLGDWDSAEAELAQSADSDPLAEVEYILYHRAWLAAMRGETATVTTILAGLSDLRASEDLQDEALISIVEAFTAASRRQPLEALGYTRAMLAHADVLGVSSVLLRWAWPLAARTAFELQDAGTARDLLALLDSYQPGYLTPTLRAERDLVRARLADLGESGDGKSGTALAAAITGLRQHGTPYHLAHGLLDQAEYLTRHSDVSAAASAVEEARVIGTRLRCQPLLDRADAVEGAALRLRALSRPAGCSRGRMQVFSCGLRGSWPGGRGGPSVAVQAAEQVAQCLNVRAEGGPALAGQGDRGFLRGPVPGLGTAEVVAFFQLAQLDDQVAGGKPEQVLQPGEGQRIPVGQRRQRRDDLQPGGHVDQRVQFSGHGRTMLRRCSQVKSRGSSRQPYRTWTPRGSLRVRRNVTRCR